MGRGRTLRLMISDSRHRVARVSMLDPGPSTQSLPPVDPPQSNSTQWFAEKLAPHETALRSYLRGMLRPVEVDDVVQEAYARVLQARESSPIASPRGLLFAVARNIARGLYRRKAIIDFSPLTEAVAMRTVDETPGVAESAIRRQETDLLQEAIDDLPTRCREVLLLRRFENLSQREIAQRLGISEHTVEAQLHKALRRFGEFFAARGFLPPRDA
jgi:RNA polymerase sigma factor (sigma-70 family)